MPAKTATRKRGREIAATAYVHEGELREIDDQAEYEGRKRSEYMRVAALDRARAARKGRT